MYVRNYGGKLSGTKLFACLWNVSSWVIERNGWMNPRVVDLLWTISSYFGLFDFLLRKLNLLCSLGCIFFSHCYLSPTYMHIYGYLYTCIHTYVYLLSELFMYIFSSTISLCPLHLLSLHTGTPTLQKPSMIVSPPSYPADSSRISLAY